MDAEIIYELERNHVYGDLARALDNLRPELHGFLAQQRQAESQLVSGAPAYRNDAHFYDQVIKARKFLQPLEEFCAARCRGEPYEEARRDMMEKFVRQTGRPFGQQFHEPEKIVLTAHQGVQEQEARYRAHHLDECALLLQTLQHYLINANKREWSTTETLVPYIQDHLEVFKEPAAARQGFKQYPRPPEMQYFDNAIQWLNERGALATVRANVHIKMDTTGLTGMFGKVTGNEPEDKYRYACYANHCEAIAFKLGYLMKDEGYLQLLKEACPDPLSGLKTTKSLGNKDMPVAVDLPDALMRVTAIHIDNFIRMPPVLFARDGVLDLRIGIETACDAINDFTDEFINNPARKPAPVYKSGRELKP